MFKKSLLKNSNQFKHGETRTDSLSKPTLNYLASFSFSSSTLCF